MGFAPPETDPLAILKAVLTATGQIVYASAPQTPAALDPGPAEQFLKSQGAGNPPAWGEI